MRFGTLKDRAVVFVDDQAVDVAAATDGAFGPSANDIYSRWEEFQSWAASADLDTHQQTFDSTELGARSPTPTQVFAIGLNYDEHAAEAGVSSPTGTTVPPTFTKFRGSLTGPYTELVLPSDKVDWEVELVIVIGKTATNVEPSDAWAHVAGLTVGQDFSERDVQREGPVPQFSMAKSYPGFGPTGPWLVTPDELAQRDDLAVECVVNGETRQKSRTSAMIVPVSDLIARLSRITTLMPGDVIFSGTPSGVGMGRTPELYLKPGDEVVSRIEGIGELRQACVASDALVASL